MSPVGVVVVGGAVMWLLGLACGWVLGSIPPARRNAASESPSQDRTAIRFGGQVSNPAAQEPHAIRDPEGWRRTGW